MRHGSSWKEIPKIPLGVRERLKMKQEAKADLSHGREGAWVQNGSFQPLYIPAWMIQAEAAALAYEGPALVLQVGPFWKEA